MEILVDRRPVFCRGFMLLAVCISPGVPPGGFLPSLAAQETVNVGRPIAPDASIKIWNGGGSVRVEGWETDSLDVSGEVDEVGGGRFFLGVEADVAKLAIEGDQGEVSGRLVVKVPARATVWIRTASADIEVRGLEGSVDINTVAGRVDVQGRPEVLYAESMQGDMDLHVTAGIARAKAGSGNITFFGPAQDLALTSVSGSLDVTAPELRRGRFNSVDGDIMFDGAVGSAAALVFETHSGNVTLHLPPDLAADFRISTFLGQISVDYPQAPRPEEGAGRLSLEFEAGDGGGEVEVRCYSGSVIIETRS